jgi:hypothetical protein
MKKWGRVMRAAALSFLMLFSLAAMLPLVISSAHNEQNVSAGKKKGVRRHSRAWWRRYRARQRRRRAALERKRALAGLRQSTTDRQAPLDTAGSSNPLSAMVWPDAGDAGRQATPVRSTEHASRPAPRTANAGVRLKTPDGRTVGQVAVAVVANASSRAASSPASQRRALSGVPFADLRRTVIDRMLAAGGWVVNDFERDINGRRVYVVLAQTAAPADGRTPQQSWTFYFTEVEGRIYNIVSNAPVEFTDRMAVEAERVLATLGTDVRPSSDRSAQRR